VNETGFRCSCSSSRMRTRVSGAIRWVLLGLSLGTRRFKSTRRTLAGLMNLAMAFGFLMLKRSERRRLVVGFLRFSSSCLFDLTSSILYVYIILSINLNFYK
jgi:hypothetical protein